MRPPPPCRFIGTVVINTPYCCVYSQLFFYGRGGEMYVPTSTPVYIGMNALDKGANFDDKCMFSPMIQAKHDIFDSNICVLGNEKAFLKVKHCTANISIN